jgi:hypothetical protein
VPSRCVQPNMSKVVRELKNYYAVIADLASGG